MSKEEKLILRLLSLPKDFTFNELSKILKRLGFTPSNKGATSGSRVAFYNPEDGNIIRIHKPHPNNEIGLATLKDIVAYLREKGYL